MSVVDALTHYNRWRRGDLETLLLSPAQIGAALDAAIADLDRLQRENVELREALAWYAEPGNWKRPTNGRKWSNSPACDDKGSRARVVMMEAGS